MRTWVISGDPRSVSAGQVYVPQVNWLLAALVLALVFGFRSSDALANAYGIAVAGDMMVTTLLVTVVAYALWRWPAALVFSGRWTVLFARPHIRVGQCS